MFELIVECVTVMDEVLLDAFEQIGGQVELIDLGVGVFADIVNNVGDELLVFQGCGVQGSLV